MSNTEFFEDYPRLDFGASSRHTAALERLELSCGEQLVESEQVLWQTWAFGIDFLRRCLRETSFRRDYFVLVHLIGTAHSALRSSFILATRGYAPDSLALIRKTHEATLRACACAAYPARAAEFARDRSVKPSAKALGLDGLSAHFSVTSGFVHSDMLSVDQAIVGIVTGGPLPGGPSPQVDSQLFGYAGVLSVFWLYFVLRTTPEIFREHVVVRGQHIIRDQIPSAWLEQAPDVVRLMASCLARRKWGTRYFADVERVVQQIRQAHKQIQEAHKTADRDET